MTRRFLGFAKNRSELYSRKNYESNFQMGIFTAPKAKTMSVSVNLDTNTTLLTIRQISLKRATDRVQKCITLLKHTALI